MLAPRKSLSDPSREGEASHAPVVVIYIAGMVRNSQVLSRRRAGVGNVLYGGGPSTDQVAVQAVVRALGKPGGVQCRAWCSAQLPPGEADDLSPQE